MPNRSHSIPAITGLTNSILANNLVNTASPSHPVVVVYITVTVATAASAIFNVYGSADNVNWALIQSTSAITAVGTYRLGLSGIIDPYLQITASSVSGTMNVGSVQVLMTPPGL